ncbi:MAG: tetratricopeptide repeat protein [Polyangiaceae bacterium]
MAINRDKILQEAQKLVDKKRYDKAIAEYQKVVADDPNDVRTLLRIGDLYLRIEQYADAISTYDRVASYYSVQGFAVKAVAVYKQIREIIQKHAPHLEDRFGHVVPKLAELLTQLDLRSDALAYYEEMATRLQHLGRERDAIDVFKKIVTLDQQNPVSHLRLADAFTRVRDFDGAAQEFLAAAEILLRIQRRDDALRVVERLLQYRQEARFCRLAAQIHLERGQPGDGMAALTKLHTTFKENPRDLETLGLLARAFDAIGQPTKSIEVQKEAARIARETNQTELFDQLLSTLLERAPHDEGVRHLVAMANGTAQPANAEPQRSRASSIPAQPVEPASVAPPPAQRPTVEPARAQQARPAPPPPPPTPIPVADADEVSVEMVMDEDELVVVSEDAPSEEEPFALRASYPPQEEDPHGVRAILAAAEMARRRGDYARAVDGLRGAIHGQPDVRELRERLCDLLIEAGDQEGAIAEMLRFAQRLVETSFPDDAARLLDEVLLLDATNKQALKLLRSLGYAVGGEEEPPSAAQPAFTSYDAKVPLPSYDLEELTSDEPPAPSTVEPAPSTVVAGDQRMNEIVRQSFAAAPPIELDDPFAQEETSFGIPAYALDDEAAQQLRQAPQPAGLDEAALEEIEFFATHDMLDEAEGLLNEQLARLPNHPLLLEKRRELAALRASASEVAAAPPPPPQAVYATAAVAPEPVAASAPPSSQVRAEVTVDRAYDIAHALDEMDQAMDSFGPRGGDAAPGPSHGQVSVDAIFEQFKAGVAAQVAESDAATHYDLGVAYKEMGLIADAIHEFELASRDSSRECVCLSMIGMLHMQNGDLESALNAFIQGLQAAEKTPDQELALTYEVGNAYEPRDPSQALYYFQMVARLDPSYRDPRGSVAERIANLERQLGGSAPSPAAKAVAVGAGDDFDAAFDDLFNPKG